MTKKPLFVSNVFSIFFISYLLIKWKLKFQIIKNFLSEINYDYIIDIGNLLFIKDSFNNLNKLNSNSNDKLNSNNKLNSNIKFLYICSESNINKLDIKKYHNIYITPSYVDDDLYIINAYLYIILIVTNDLHRDHIN